MKNIFKDRPLGTVNCFRNMKIMALAAFTLICMTVAQAATIRYVKEGGRGRGISWDEASGDLQAMINISMAGDEIWVAAGTYKPTHSADGYNATATEYFTVFYPPVNTNPDDRKNAFILKEGVKIYGGFVPASLPSTSSVPVFGSIGRNGVSTLSGDLGVEGNSSDNAYHVVISVGLHTTITKATVLDGFTISGGQADGTDIYPMVNTTSIHSTSGGGIVNTHSSPTFRNLVIVGNSASHYGGGIFNFYESSPTLINVVISGNMAIYDGGGISNEAGSPALTNVVISGNSARRGGGIYTEVQSLPTLTNVTVSGNFAFSGGGIYNNAGSILRLNNSIVWGNKANQGSGIYTWSDTLNDPVIAYSLVEGIDGTGNIDGTVDYRDLFVSPIDPATAPNSGGNFRLLEGSPCINKGCNDSIPTGITTDVVGVPRILDGVVDIGAFEYMALPFLDYVGILWNNLFILNKKKLEDEGFSVISCRWYENDRLLGEKLFYSCGNDRSNVFTAGAKYRFEIETTAGTLSSTTYIHQPQQAEVALNASPNPTDGDVKVESSDCRAGDAIELFDLNGRRMAVFTADGPVTTISLNGLANGVYLVKLNGKQVKVVISK